LVGRRDQHMPKVLLEFDKAHAEWVCVAYLSGDARMIEIAESSIDPHLETGHMISGAPRDLIREEEHVLGHHTDEGILEEGRKDLFVPISQMGTRTENISLLNGNYFVPRTMTIRQMGKKANHGLNYRQTYVGFGETYEVNAADSKKVVTGYAEAYPGLSKWWVSIEEELRTNKRVKQLASWSH